MSNRPKEGDIWVHRGSGMLAIVVLVEDRSGFYGGWGAHVEREDGCKVVGISGRTWAQNWQPYWLQSGVEVASATTSFFTDIQLRNGCLLEMVTALSLPTLREIRETNILLPR